MVRKLLLAGLVFLLPLSLLGEESFQEFSEEELLETAPVVQFRMNFMAGQVSGILQEDYGGVQRERIVLEPRLGMETTRAIPEIEFAFGSREGGYFHFLALYSGLFGSKVLEQDLFFQGTTYPKDTKVDFSGSLLSLQLGFFYPFVYTKDGMWGMGIGLGYMSFEHTLSAKNFPRETLKQEGLFPLYRTAFHLRLIGFTSLFGQLTLGGLGVEEIREASKWVKEFFYFRLFAGVRLALVPGVNLLVGYYHLRASLLRRKDTLLRRAMEDFRGLGFSFEVLL